LPPPDAPPVASPPAAPGLPIPPAPGGFKLKPPPKSSNTPPAFPPLPNLPPGPPLAAGGGDGFGACSAQLNLTLQSYTSTNLFALFTYLNLTSIFDQPNTNWTVFAPKDSKLVSRTPVNMSLLTPAQTYYDALSQVQDPRILENLALLHVAQGLYDYDTLSTHLQANKLLGQNLPLVIETELTDPYCPGQSITAINISALNNDDTFWIADSASTTARLTRTDGDGCPVTVNGTNIRIIYIDDALTACAPLTSRQLLRRTAITGNALLNPPTYDINMTKGIASRPDYGLTNTTTQDWENFVQAFLSEVANAAKPGVGDDHTFFIPAKAAWLAFDLNATLGRNLTNDTRNYYATQLAYAHISNDTLHYMDLVTNKSGVTLGTVLGWAGRNNLTSYYENGTVCHENITVRAVYPANTTASRRRNLLDTIEHSINFDGSNPGVVLIQAFGPRNTANITGIYHTYGSTDPGLVSAYVLDAVLLPCNLNSSLLAFPPPPNIIPDIPNGALGRGPLALLAGWLALLVAALLA
jgi:hypothetical protein